MNNTSGHTSYSNNYFYSDYTSGWPTGNPSSDGGAPVVVVGASADYTSGATWADILYFGGPGFRIRVGHGGGTLYVGRNTGNGGAMIDSADGGVLTGGICGYFDWITVMGAPTMLQTTPQEAGKILVQFSGSGDTGGSGPDGNWQYQYADNPSFTGAGLVYSPGTSIFTGTPGVTYYFRARGHNAVGWSNWSGTLSAQARGGGKYGQSGTFKDLQAYYATGGTFKTVQPYYGEGGTWKVLG